MNVMMTTSTVFIVVINLLVLVQCVPDVIDLVNNENDKLKLSPVRWAITSLTLPGHDFARRNAKVASAMKPYAKAHSFTFIFFSESVFPQQDVESWKNVLGGIGEIKVVNTASNGFEDHTEKGGRRYGYNYMCKFYAMDIYSYLGEYDYYMRLDTDAYLMPLQYDIWDWIYRNHVEYGYASRKIEAHVETVQTLPPWVTAYVRNQSIVPSVPYPSLSICMEFYNNFHIGKVSYFLRPEVQKFLHAVHASGNIMRYRWGDSPIQAYAARLFMDPLRIRQLPMFQYVHEGHHVLLSTDPAVKSGRINGRRNWVYHELPNWNWTHEERPELYQNIKG